MYKKIISFASCFTGLFLITLSLWTNKYFGTVTIDHVLSTVGFGLRSTIQGNSFFTQSFILYCLCCPAVITLVISRMSSRYLDFFLLVAGMVLVTHQYNIIDYFNHQKIHHTDFYAEHYISPSKVNISALHPKSLVLIYVESLETTYANSNLFGRDLLRNLTQLNVNHISFAHYHEMPGTNWSIAGIIATQCAVPLMIDTRNLNAELHVLSRAQCLGDILAANGYKNIYMNGSRLSFAGVSNFFKDHHYTELYGREAWLRAGLLNKKDMTTWGLPDDMLLDLAKIRLGQLVKQDQPFNLTLFTIDTHGVSGQLSQTCAQAGYHDFPGIVECTANQLASFIAYVDKQGWLDKLNIIVIGDHLAMKNVVSDKLATQKNRYIFNMLISKNKLTKNTEEVVPFDMLPTILSSLGFDYQPGRLGLGYNAVGMENKERPAGRLKTLTENVLFTTKTYHELWRIDA